ncbi:hypothetical protein ABT160_19860 [Streptomyces sp. NPDC001941]|uniref:hypothetical protein n=1 Tax=Streptomyces sp. NPDC001941 TaxID=3154659 RepID=UPI0033172A58
MGSDNAVVCDESWAGEVRDAVRCAALLLVLLLAVDGGDGELTWPRAVLWVFLAALLFTVLYPARVRAGPGYLESRGLLGPRVVRTDRLVAVRWSEGVSQRLVLRDAEGGRVEVDPRTLLSCPALWHRVALDARGCVERGELVSGAGALLRLEGEVVRGVFRVSGL